MLSVANKSLCWVSLCWMLYCWVLLCWVSWRPIENVGENYITVVVFFISLLNNLQEFLEVKISIWNKVWLEYWSTFWSSQIFLQLIFFFYLQQAFTLLSPTFRLRCNLGMKTRSLQPSTQPVCRLKMSNFQP